MAINIVQVDTFTDLPFTGNPAAVCLLDEAPPEWWLLNVAREINLPATAFLAAHEDGYDLRSFTPQGEVDLCEHATLASAHMLWEDGHLAPTQVARFHTRSGVVTARRDGDWIELDCPAEPADETPGPESLQRAVGALPIWVGRTRRHLLVEVDNEKVVRTLTPDRDLLRGLDPGGVIVTSSAVAGRYDFVSRFFAPCRGIDEDSVTVSAHCVLGPFWAERLGRDRLIGFQLSARGGTVRVSCNGGRVLLGGKAVTVLMATLVV